jgi:predicted lipoprotein with Yx(FWY)xxD motif
MKTQITIIAALTSLLAMPAFADSTAVVTMAESDSHVSFLADDLGRPLYFFMTDNPGGANEAGDACTSEECLKLWPFFTSNGPPKAGPKAIASLLGTMNHAGQTVVTYNGRPLHYFVQDVDEDLFDFGAPQGDNFASFGGRGRLVQAAGKPLD